MIVIKVSISKSDLQGHSSSLAMVPVDMPRTISYKYSIATMSLSCTVSEILSLVYQNLKRLHDTEHIAFWGRISCMREYFFVSVSKRNLRYLASPIPKI